MLLSPHPDLEAFERAQVARDAPDFYRNLRLYEALYEEAVALGIFPLKAPLDGIEVDLHLAKALNVQATPRSARSGPG